MRCKVCNKPLTQGESVAKDTHTKYYDTCSKCLEHSFRSLRVWDSLDDWIFDIDKE